MLIVVTVLFPIVMFIGGAYFLDYPIGLGALYGINVAIIYLVLLSVINQVVKIHSQEISTADGALLLKRNQLSPSFPVVCPMCLDIPLASVKSIKLMNTRLGYQLTAEFLENDKTMGVDLDLNPLRIENKQVLEEVFLNHPEIETDDVTRQIMEEYPGRVLAWKTNFLFSFSVLALALVVFFLVSIFLGTIID